MSKNPDWFLLDKELTSYLDPIEESLLNNVCDIQTKKVTYVSSPD